MNQDKDEERKATRAIHRATMKQIEGVSDLDEAHLLAETAYALTDRHRSPQSYYQIALTKIMSAETLDETRSTARAAWLRMRRMRIPKKVR